MKKSQIITNYLITKKTQITMKKIFFTFMLFIASISTSYAQTTPTITINTIEGDDYVNATERPTVEISGTSTNIANGGIVGLSFSRTDITNAPATVTNNSWSYTIPSGQVSIIGDVAVTVTASFSGATDVTRTFTIDTRAPVLADDIDDQEATIGTDFSFSIPSGTFTDTNTLTYTSSALTNGLTFATDTWSGVGSSLTAGTVTVTVTATDPAGNTATDEFDIVISAAATASPNAPTDITLSGATNNAKSIAENTTEVGTFTTTDADVSDTHTYTLASGTGDEDNGKFTLDSATGVLSFTTAPDFETPTDAGDTAGDNTYAIRVETTDGTTPFAKAFIITVTDVVNDVAPTPPTIASFSLTAGNAYAKTETLTFTDANNGDTLTAVWFPSGASNCTVATYNSGSGSSSRAQITLSGSSSDNSVGRMGDITYFVPERDDPSAYNNNRYLCVGVTDGTNVVVQRSDNQFSGLQKNSRPTIAFSPSSQDTSGKQTFDLTINVTDSNTDQTVTAKYKVIDSSAACEATTTDTGATDITAAIGATNGKTVTLTFNSEDDNDKKVCVNAEDGSGIPSSGREEDITDSILATAAPTDSHTITGIDTTVPVLAVEIPDQTATERTDFSFPIPPGTFTDANTLTYTSTGQANGITFATDTWSGTGVSLMEGTVTITVTATDAAGNSVTDEFTITIAAAPVSPNAPTDITLSGATNNAKSIAENTTEVGTFTTTDADGSDTHTYTLVSGTGDEDNGKFTLDLATGVLSFTAAPDFETPTDAGDTAGDNTYAIRVETTDGTTPFEKAFIITVTDVNEPTPPAIDDFSISQTSGEYSKTITGITFTDPDDGDTLEAHWYPSGASNCNKNSYDVVVGGGNGAAIDLSAAANSAGRTGDILFFIPDHNTAAQWGNARYICVGVTDGTDVVIKRSTNSVGNGNLVKNDQPIIIFDPAPQDTSAKTTFDLVITVRDSNLDQTIEAEYKIIDGGSSCDATTTETGETAITTSGGSGVNRLTETITFNQETDNGKKVCVTARDDSGIPETETTVVSSFRIRETYLITGIDTTAPSLDNAIPDQTATVGVPFVFELLSNTFSDSNTITYTTSGEGSGIAFRSSDNSWRGIPTAEATLMITVTATDAVGNVATDEFNIVIGPNASGVVPSAPGGVLSGLSFWLNALFGVVADPSGIVTAWADTSPNPLGLDDTEVNGTPKLIENGINFNPAVDLVNEDNIPKSYFLVRDEYLLKGNDDFTAVVVVAPDHVNRRTTLISGTNNQSVQFRIVEGRPALHSRSNGGDIIKSTTGSKVSAGKAAILGVRRDGNNYSVYQDGRSFSGTNTTTLSTGSNTFRIGINQSNRQHLSGDLGEVFIYDDNLADADLAKVFTNLAIKYGVTLNSEIANYVNSAGTSVYDNSTYNNTVIAIARDEGLGVNQRISKSAKDGSILTISTDSNFEAVNTTHEELSDGQYLVIGHNGGAVNQSSSELPTGFSYRTAREWKVGNTGSVGAVNLKFEGDYNQGDFLVTDADGDFSAGAVEVGALNADGEIEATLTDGSYFILAAKADSTVGGLATLTSSTGTTLSPAFSTTTEAYDITIPSADTSFSLTPTLASSDTSLTVNGESVVSGEVVELPVLGGLNTIRLVVTSANGFKTREYTVSFSRDFEIEFHPSFLSTTGVYWDDGETETIDFITRPALAAGTNVFDYKIGGFPGIFSPVSDGRIREELRATFDADDVEYTDTSEGILRLPYDVKEVINNEDINTIVINIEDDPGTNSYSYSIPTGAPNTTSVIVDDQDIKYTVPATLESGVPITLTPTTEGFEAFTNPVVYSFRGGSFTNDNDPDVVPHVRTPNEVTPGLFLNTSTGVISGTPLYNPDGAADNVVKITATSGGKTARTTIVIPRATVSNSAPTDITLTLTNATVNENQTVVGAFSTTDADASDSHTYTLATGTGDEDNDKFTLDTATGVIAFTTAPDHENPTDAGDTAGDNTYAVRVQTDDGNGGTFEKEFIITVTDVAENDADLSNLVVTGATITPAFTSANITYSGTVETSVASVTVTPTRSHPEATITVGGTAATSGSASTVTLSDGLNAIEVVVTAEDGTTTKTYTINITRTSTRTITIFEVSDGYVNDAEDESTVTISGTTANIPTSDNLSISLTSSGNPRTATIQSNGDWSIDLPSLVLGNVEGTITVTATHTGTPSTTATQTFVYDATAPTLAAAIDDQTATVGTDFSFPIPTGAFTDANTITYTSSGESNGITFATDTWSAVGADLTAGTVTITVTATDAAGNTQTDEFDIVIAAPLTTWTGTTDSTWTTATNWTDGVPTATHDVIIPKTTNQPTAATAVTVNKVTINSGASLIANAAFNGNVIYNREINFVSGSLAGWYLMASPVVGETYDDTYVAANDIAQGSPNNRGIATYNTSANSWEYFQGGGSGTFVSGKGYSIKKQTSTGAVAFTGTLNTDDVGVVLETTATNRFNLLGNPYPSYLNSTTFLNSETAISEEKTLWVWNQEISMYEAKNLVETLMIAPGQGFFVKANTGGGTFNFSKANQSHTATDTFQKSVKTQVKLDITDGDNHKNYCKIYYSEETTSGFDVGYDGELFSGAPNPFAIYTHLVSDSEGEHYQIQSLPYSDIENMVIPVGVNAASGKEISISADVTNFPAGVHLYLEDKLENSFTKLDENDAKYTVTLSDDLEGIGRFFLRASSSDLDDFSTSLENISVYTSSKNNLRIVGIQDGNVKLKAYNILGVEIIDTSFKGNGKNDVAIPSLAAGIYIIHLEMETGKVSKKIVVE